MRFFGLKVKPGIAYDVQVPKGKRLHLTAVCVDSLKADGGLVVVVTIEEKEHVIAVLEKGQPMVNVDLVFNHGQKVAFSLKEGTKIAHLTGYFELDTDLYFTEAGALEEFGDDSDSEGEWISDEDDEEAIKQAMLELSKQAKQAPEKEEGKKKAVKAGTKRPREEADPQPAQPAQPAQQPAPAGEEQKKKKAKKKKAKAQ
eukprot:TRINITY_DN3791_c0_g3_i1.p1 TRINITY_DN3791_c0_g3~~TRINITY_DN3791_c0_g3_i1.p1  ORF type:complete len:200 (+),score=58.77 TRINITY_DN3791_c0_g3_i1:99-698(+)